MGETGINKASLGPTVLLRCSGSLLFLPLTCILYPSAVLQTIHIFASASQSPFSRDAAKLSPTVLSSLSGLSCHSTLWSLPRVTVINYHKFSGLDDRNVFSCNSMGQKSEIKVSVGLGSLPRGEPFLPPSAP